MNLIIVESPTKAKTLSRFLGKEYQLEATMGHIKDLPKSRLSVDIENDFTPSYIALTKKKEQIKKLIAKAEKADQIYLATDPDREGEAIAAHVKEVLEDGKSQKRIVFHEITKNAVEEAIKNPRDIDRNLVDAQTARRVLDRLVGYKLSPLLWKKVRRGLSAGRVQSVAVRLIVEREREIEKFKPLEYWEIFCELAKKKERFEVKLIKIGDKKAEVKNGQEAGKIVSDLKKSSYKVSDVRKREVRRNPYPPFTTSTMTQSSAKRSFWSAKRTMSIAQKLYEEGLITYHRTDSVHVARSAAESARSFIKKEYGEKYLPEKPRVYKTKAKVAQEAHEAIRPTGVSRPTISNLGFKKDLETLYSLIWRRFVASQMAASVYDETVIEVTATNKIDYRLRVSGQIMKFDGFRKVLAGRKEKEAVQLPEVSVNDQLQLIKVSSEQKFTEPPARYNEASLIKTLEKLGIGRPSTYAPTISTIQLRQYVEKKEGRFFSTPVGAAVSDFLVKNFPDIFDYQFTAEMEDDLDKIANGKIEWTTSIKKFWDPFEKKLEDVEYSKRVKIETEKLGKKCPDCKKGELVVRIGRFGKFISCSRFPDCDYTEKYLEKIGMKCPGCGKGDVIIKTTKKKRKFYGCSRFPNCKWASWRKPKLSS